ncbi:hypothetical protein [Methanoregula formicica]|uniref:Uncharacterized protein n=1 Tax=Methanoregula formicica (strain DSM 22288 / NBRC 105244 / SMSP) TaxID=593750 RepID=L0HHW2_METFS|nr:hypothetical protein [Methanoregula formicica]AGB02913.1 hypothetical protein Metfor_1892 [Methanoregula formicica SMSP]
MSTTDSAGAPSQGAGRYCEAAVPLIAFGVTGAGLILWSAGYPVDFQYVSIGCTISSFILAYLAWIRPRKDIVALSTPIYGIVFLATPIEAGAGAVLQLLYAAGLTILLIRLKRRFSEEMSGPAPLSPDEPLGKYQRRILTEMPAVSPALARAAGRVFIRFAEGEYEESCRLASGVPELADGTAPGLVERAFAIVSFQAGRMGEKGLVPDEFSIFSAEQQHLLFSPLPDNTDKERMYNRQLENALILLYVIALGSTDKEIQAGLDGLRPFARRLGGE